MPTSESKLTGWIGVRRTPPIADRSAETAKVTTATERKLRPTSSAARTESEVATSA
jgi:hypothetical protein